MEIIIPFLKARFISNAITFFIVWKYATKQLKLYRTQEDYLDKAQVIDNIKNDRRFDWGTGKEDNWRHTWNSDNPIEHKSVTIKSIMLKSFFIYFIGGTIIEVLTNVIMAL